MKMKKIKLKNSKKKLKKNIMTIYIKKEILKNF